MNNVNSVLLCGYLDDDQGGIDAVNAKDPALFQLMSICSIHGKPARCRYRVVEHFYRELEDRALLPLTWVDLTPETGGTHQLCIHCQQLVHPILVATCMEVSYC